jgi:hypothetical protein
MDLSGAISALPNQLKSASTIEIFDVDLTWLTFGL